MTISKICKSFGGWFENHAWRFPTPNQMEQAKEALAKARYTV